ncbi:hypothetical protein CHU94_10455 [Rhodoferax sp. TH121]|uniref:Hpt domain-containing response regulator n=1 Tax=Rhodoferax sp. TH121 TaxID=2022803 RepID=UPI000B967E75|nr:response regulator [Rhodoferax sp. TH121]OYQ39767.1 hypothetical protein CHU94_10455 [Rhodoferax sp. TH121]
MTSAAARILLVDDDPALRRFVHMALEDMPLELIACDRVNSAVQVLQEGAVQVIITDLMMPGESGLGLLQRLKEQPALRGPARVVVLSAGLTPTRREELVHMEVWCLLDKPVSVVQLVDCINEALAPAAPKPPANAAPEPLPANAARAHAQASIEEYFGGNGELYRAYRATCLAQFAHDVHNGDTAAATRDLVSLRHLAHNAKSVLRMLGYPTQSAQALALEEDCAAGRTPESLAGWDTLRSALQAIGKP